MRVFPTLALGVSLIAITVSTQAKIAACPAITQGNITYFSHLNYIEAISTTNQQIIWHTPLFGETGNFLRGLIARLAGMESDITTKVVCIKNIQDNRIIATAGDMTYMLDKNTGKEISP